MFISKLYLKIRLFKVNWQKNRGKLSKSSLSPALVRGFLLSRFPTQPFISCQGDAFFFRIKRQTYTRPPKIRLYALIIKKIKACICLFNTYTTHTRVVTLFNLRNEQKYPIIWIYEQKCVYDVYVLCICLPNIYTHLTKWLTIHYQVFFALCICLAFNSKKNHTCNLYIINLVALLCLRCTSSCRSVSSPL